MPGTMSMQNGVVEETATQLKGTSANAGQAASAATSAAAPQRNDDARRFEFAALWLDQNRSKMTLSITDIDCSSIMTHIAKILKDRHINIEAGRRLRLKRSTGTILEIAGEHATMQDLYDKIVHNQMETPPQEEMPVTGATYEFEVIAPDRSGILHDIVKRLHECHINASELVITTEQTADGRKGIVYARLAVPSEQALTEFENQLSDFPDWQWDCRPWDRRPRIVRPAAKHLDSPN
jgi:glycine cleavage system regulatory protein